MIQNNDTTIKRNIGACQKYCWSVRYSAINNFDKSISKWMNKNFRTIHIADGLRKKLSRIIENSGV